MITKAAIKVDGEIYTGLCHADINRELFKLVSEEKISYESFKERIDGFVNDSGEFLTREESAIHAFNCGQISRKLHRLTSVDIDFRTIQ